VAGVSGQQQQRSNLLLLHPSTEGTWQQWQGEKHHIELLPNLSDEARVASDEALLDGEAKMNTGHANS
jgi:hypothetical protein